MSDEEAISLSDESEGEGPNIRPPQAAGGSHGHGGHARKHHKQKHRDRDMWRQGRHREADRGDRGHRERRKGEGRQERRQDRRDDRSDGRGHRDTLDLRHRLKEKHARDFPPEDRGPRSDRYHHERDRSRGDREHGHGSVKSNRFLEADKHREDRKRDVEEARRQRELLEKEMEIIADKLKRKNKARSRSRSGRRGRKSESGQESGEESENEEISDEEEEDEEESGSGSEAGSGSDATGSQKSEDTPNREDSDDGVIEDDEDEQLEEAVKAKKSKSRSHTPIEGRWAERSSSAERTPSRSPTPMKGEEDMEVEQEAAASPHHSPLGPFSKPGSPSDLLLPKPPAAASSPAAAAPAAEGGPATQLSLLPPYLPSVHGCRSVIEFSCLNRIEEGTYGVVYRARDKKTQEIVALKKLKMEKEKEGFPITSLREINTLLISQHINVVTVREIVVGSNIDQIYIVMDFVEHDMKSLMETMRKKNQVFLPGEVKCLMVQLLRAIHHLHDNWILHRDLKSSNLLLSHNGILKVGDFGLAREYGSPLKAYTSIVVTLWYRAPELLLGMKKYSTHIDVWSIGCIFGELLLMEPLFPGKSETDELNKIFKLLGTPSEKCWKGFNTLPGAKVKFVDHPVSTLRDKFPERMLSESGLTLLKELLTYDPKDRITCEEALASGYFTEAPLPIDPSMFPTWPAKSEQDPQDKLKKGASPKAPSGGHAFKKIQGDDDEERAMRSRGFNLLDSLKNQAPSSGFTLRF